MTPSNKQYITYAIAKQHPTRPEVSIFTTTLKQDADQYEALGWTVLPLIDLGTRTAQPATTEWTLIAPDGTRFTGPSPGKTAIKATGHHVKTDPVAAANFADAIEKIRAEGEAEHDRCMREYGTLNCPACGGSGHIADAMGAQPTKAMIDAAERIDWSDSDVRGNIVNMWYAMQAVAGAQPSQPPAGLTEQFIDDFLTTYIMEGEDDQGRDCSYSPNEHEIAITKDAILGMLAELESQQSQARERLSDAEMLDYLQNTGSTVSIVCGEPFAFMVGGYAGRTNADLRKAIIAAINAKGDAL